MIFHAYDIVAFNRETVLGLLATTLPSMYIPVLHGQLQDE